MMDRLALFAVKDDASAEDVDDLLSSIRKLGDRVPNVVVLPDGETFSEQSKGHPHELFVRVGSSGDLQAYLEHPEHRAVVEKLDAITTGRLVVDYEHEL